MLPRLDLVNGFDIRAGRRWLQWLRIESDWLFFVSWARTGGHSPFLIDFKREAFPHSSWVKRENTEVVFISWRRLHTFTMASEKVRVWTGWKCLGKLPQCYSLGGDELSVSVAFIWHICSSCLERDLAFPCMARKVISYHANIQCLCLAQSVQKLFQKSKMGLKLAILDRDKEGSFIGNNFKVIVTLLETSGATE